MAFLYHLRHRKSREQPMEVFMEIEHTTVLREAVGVFDTKDQLDETIKDLRTSGFGRHEISVRGSDAAVQEQYGRPFIDPTLLQDDPGAPRSTLVVPEELGVAQGVLLGVGMLAGAALGVVATDGAAGNGATATVLAGVIIGAVFGSMLVWLLSSQYYRFFRTQEKTGGIVLWIKTEDAAASEKAQAILKRHGAHDVHVHDMAVAA